MKYGEKSLFMSFVHCLTLSLALFGATHAKEAANENTTAIINTNLGTIELKLFDNKAPVTVSNFVKYANEKFYDNTIFHRVIPNFMIQGGGFDANMSQKATKAPIINEANPLTPNSRGTIAMARTSDPNSATAQFFINVIDNTYLNKSPSSAGYAVFGEVIKGMDVADIIARVKTKSLGYMRDVPAESVVITSIRIK